MRSVVLLLLGIHLVFADFPISDVICDRVLGHVGEKIIFTCRVLPQGNNICILRYKFMDNHYKTICEEEFGDTCQQRTSFSCPYIPNTIMNSGEQFNFIFEQKDLTSLTGISGTITDFAKTTCKKVPGTVGEKINLNCRVSYQSDKCCVLSYKFMKNTNDDDDTTICKEEFSYNPCRQLTSVLCPDTENTPMTRHFKFFLNTTCGPQTTKFTVSVKDGDDGGKTAITASEVIDISVGCVLALTVFIAIMGLMVWRKSRQVMSRELTGDVKESAQSTSLRSLQFDHPNF